MSGSWRAFGVEEEYLLLDEVSGMPVNRADEILADTPELDEQTEREYFSSQLETATPICHEAHEAETSLVRVRRTFAAAATARGIVLAGTGLPPVGGDEVGLVTPKTRYRRIEAEIRGAARHQYATGTHVHVEVPTPDAGVDVLGRLARWAPALLAMAANSPIWCGEPSGFSSWRHVHGLGWPVAGYPVGFSDEAEYRRATDQLVQTGIVPDLGLLTWTARLSHNYPTVEFRIGDSQLEAGDAVAFAVIIRALVDWALDEHDHQRERPNYAPAMVNGASWLAARNGLSSELVDLLTAESLPAFEFVDRMLHTIEAQLDRFDDRARVSEYVAKLRSEGDPASRQLRTYERAGIPGLLELYRASYTRPATA